MLVADYVTWITDLLAVDTGVHLGAVAPGGTDVTVGGLVVAAALLIFGLRAVKSIKRLG